jgi:hypothetical protein
MGCCLGVWGPPVGVMRHDAPLRRARGSDAGLASGNLGAESRCVGGSKKLRTSANGNPKQTRTDTGCMYLSPLQTRNNGGRLTESGQLSLFPARSSSVRGSL